MNKHKNKVIIAIVVMVILSGAWFWGGIGAINHPSNSDGMHLHDENDAPIDMEIDNSLYIYTSADEINILGQEYEDYEVEEEYGDDKGESNQDEYEAKSDEGKYGYDGSKPDERHEELREQEELEEEGESDEPYAYERALLDMSTDSYAFDTATPIYGTDWFTQTPEGVISPNINQASTQIFASYHPEMRAPVEPENMVIGDGSFTVTLSVRAHTILYNMHLLHQDKHELVPEDGWILPPTVVAAYEGESVFNVLQREMRRNRIHMVSRWTPIFNSAYVEAINNLYEFDVGPLSGWMYSVDGWFPNFGASRYLLSDGDVIEWVYTVDLGRDLGVLWLGGE